MVRKGGVDFPYKLTFWFLIATALWNIVGASIAVPAFYIFAFFINPEANFTMSDYWRWWVVHLWVEGIFEVFAVVVIGFLLVSMKLVTKPFFWFNNIPK